MSSSNLLRIILLLISVGIVFAQVLPSRTNYWNANWYNVTVSSDPGTVLNIVSTTFATDWFDNNLNQTYPIEINVTYAVQTNGPAAQFATFNVSLYGWIGLALNSVLLGGNTAISPVVHPQATSFCSQLSSTSVVNVCPFWASLHFLSGAAMTALCHSSLPRCDSMSVRWPFTVSQTGSSGVNPVYANQRGNVRCSGASSYQGQAGNSNTITSITSLALYGMKFTANATGLVKRVYFQAQAINPFVYNFWIYNDNIATPVGGTLLSNAIDIFDRGTMQTNRAGITQLGNNWFSMDNTFFPSLTVTSGSVYWLLGIVSGANNGIPTVAGGCAALSSYTSTAAIAAIAQPPLTGPAGTVSNNCYFMYIETC